MKSLFVLAACSVAALGCAQGHPFEPPTNSGIRVGFAYPIDSGLRNVSTTYFGLGLDLPVSFSFSKEAESILSIDYITQSTSGGHGTIIPVLFNERFYQKTEPGSARPYFIAGLGLASVDITGSNIRLAGKAGVGAEFSNSIYGEATLLYTDASEGSHGTALGFYLGYRF